MAHSTRVSGNIFVYFWLPIGKDEFGFPEKDKHNMAALDTVKHDFDGVIADRLLSVLKSRITDSTTDGISYNVNTSFLGDHSSGLRFWSVPVEASYQQKRISGIFQCFSNGLYLYEFLGDSFAEIAEAKEFCNHFNTTHIVQLLAGGIKRCQSHVPNDQASYRPETRHTILNYFQADLLFNCLYNMDTVLHEYLELSVPDEIQKLREAFDPATILLNVPLHGHPTTGREGYYEHNPIVSKRKSYTARPDSKDFQWLIGPKDHEKIFFFADRPENVEGRTRLLRRMTASACEQFLRVGTSFGLRQYQSALRLCRQRESDSYSTSQANSALRDLRSKSYEGISSQFSSAHLIATFFTKVPSLRLVHDLAEDVLDYCKGNKGSDVPDPDELSYACQTAFEALNQYDRTVSLLKDELHQLQTLFLWGTNQRFLEELRETRKSHEIDSQRLALGRDVAADLTARFGLPLALLGLGIAVSEGYFGAWQVALSAPEGSFLTKLSNSALGQTEGFNSLLSLLLWVAPLFVLVAFFIVILRLLRNERESIRPARNLRNFFNGRSVAFWLRSVGNSTAMHSGDKEAPSIRVSVFEFPNVKIQLGNRSAQPDVAIVAITNAVSHSQWYESEAGLILLESDYFVERINERAFILKVTASTRPGVGSGLEASSINCLFHIEIQVQDGRPTLLNDVRLVFKHSDPSLRVEFNMASKSKDRLIAKLRNEF